MARFLIILAICYFVEFLIARVMKWLNDEYIKEQEKNKK
jgi:hypothetical protein